MSAHQATAGAALRALLGERLRGTVVIVGMGNPLRGDDGFGPALIARLRGRVRATCLDAGTTPECHTGPIIRERPETIVIVDAVHLGRAPGDWALLGGEELLTSGLSTHDASPRLLIDYLRERTQRACTVYQSDPDAEYAKTIEIDVSALEPQISFPHSPAKAVPVSQAMGIKIDQVVIGSCTNGR